MRWRWSNVPIPELHLAALGAAAMFHWLVPLRLPLPGWLRFGVGGPMVAGGMGLAGWAIASAGDADVERASELVTRGAFAVSRNPMYLGWSAGVVGTAVLCRSAWLAATAAVAIRMLHREVRAEEVRLAERFGVEYSAYRARVPRYLVRAADRLGSWQGSRQGS